MQEFSTVTASSYDAEALTPLLNDKAADGWSVVSIVAAGSSIVAYLQREADPAAADTPVVDTPAAETEAPAADTPDHSAAPAVAAAAVVATQPDVVEAPAAVEEPAGWAAEPNDSVDTPSDDTASADTGVATGDQAEASIAELAGGAETATPNPRHPKPRRQQPKPRLLNQSLRPPKPRQQPSRLCRPAGTPIRRAATNCGTGTARRGPSTCHARASSSPTHRSPDRQSPHRRSNGGAPRTLIPMRATSIGHAGILVETDAGSIVCDPWFVPAFFGSWFVFPRNDQLSDDLLERIENADFLYISHLHGDHHDEPWLRNHLRRDIPILLPNYPTREQQRTLQALGFTEFIRTVDTEELEIAPGLTIAIHVETSITDGPGGDSAIMITDGETILVNQNDCRTNDLGQLRAHGPVDLHWLQFSGAIWYPMVYDMPDAQKRELCDAKVSAQFARAMRYVENIDARHVVPSAGPPAFLDDDLFALNMIDGDEMSIFPDQTAFLRRLAEVGRHGVMNVPGTTIDISPESVEVTHPMPTADVEAIFTDKRAYLDAYRADWAPWLHELKASWNPPSTDLLTTLRAWWEPLLEMAPTLRAQVGANVLINAGELAILVDFPNGEVRLHEGEPFSFRFDIPRELVETVVAQRAVDWSNSLLLSCRFTAWRDGEFNEYVYNFLKSLSRERMRRAEAEVVRKLTPVDVLAQLDEDDIRIGDYVVQRRCPHRNADLEAFGEIDGCDFVCTLHGWRFDLETGRNKTASDQPIRIRPATPATPAH